MRILVIEDDRDKLRDILVTIKSSIALSKENVDIARDIKEATRYLKAVRYDVMILDIVVPFSPDAEPNESAGLELLQELIEDEDYYFPGFIFGLTAFPEIVAANDALIAKSLFQLIVYNSGSTEWSRLLTQRLQLLHRSIADIDSSPDLDDPNLTDVCVITALDNPELQSALRLDYSWSGLEVKGDVTLYHRGAYDSLAGRRSIVVASANQMGMSASSSLAAKMIEIFKPKFIIMIGIIGGMRARCQLGDVIVAHPVWDWGSSKIEQNVEGSVNLIAPYQIPLESAIIHQMTALSSDRFKLDSIRSAFSGRQPSNVLSIHIGPVASGSAVLANQNTAELIEQQHRKLIGIEMESYGVYVAASQSRLPHPMAISIKGVTDFVDATKDDSVREYAAYTSASVLHEFLVTYT